jgi:sulfatase modifying factor 1
VVSKRRKPKPVPAPGPTALIKVQGGKLPAGSELAGTSVASFQIGKYEVTWAEWKEVRDWAIKNGYLDLAGVGQGSSDKHPVRDVNWYDVIKWCNAKSQKEGLVPIYSFNGTIYRHGEGIPISNLSANGYRLPTEAEWEWAARGGVSSKGYTFSGSNEIRDVGWSDLDYPAQTQIVGLKSANEIGLFDMSGNVAEWCFETYENSKILRGGGWQGHFFIYCAVAYRDRGFPTDRYGYIGFRLARNLAK